MDELDKSMRELIGDAREVHGVTESEEVPSGEPLVDTQFNRLLFKPDDDSDCLYWDISNLLDESEWEELEE